STSYAHPHYNNPRHHHHHQHHHHHHLSTQPPAIAGSSSSRPSKPIVYMTKDIYGINDLCEFFTKNRPVSLYNTTSFDILYEVILKKAFPFDDHIQSILRLIITMYGPPSPEHVTRFINNPSGYVYYNTFVLGQYLHI